ncbi:MAG: FAD binding domain-containing protein [Anaerolineaceae bacterium]|nr:FAD binding domain-containing protein [Anaerolineaceae bacterium]
MDGHSHINEMTNSHLLVNDFDYMEASTVEEALAELTRYQGKARILAGGTDLMVMMKMERVRPEVLINISKIPGLNEIKELPDGSISIGALTAIHTLAVHPLVRTRYPGLAEAAGSFGSTQIEMMGTIGGNICNGSPAADTPPALLALCAQVILVSQTGKRFMPLEQFFLGPGKTALQPGEMLAEVTLPAPQVGSTSVFLKATRVVADLAKASLAVSITRQGERISSCRVAMGSVAPTPLLLPKVADVLVGRIFSADLLAEAGKLIAQAISPIDDVRSSAWYRRQIANVMLQDALTSAWGRAEEGAKQINWQSLSKVEDKTFVYAHSQKSGERQEIELKVNGRKTRVWVAANELLLNVLRGKLELTGTKYACGIGECSACTVQIDGKPMLSCLILAVSAVGKEIKTVEGLQDPDTAELDPVQEAFIDNTAFQCGYCTPGILMTTKALLSETPKPSEDEVRHYLRGNTCRCTGYASIVRAVLDAAEKVG